MQLVLMGYKIITPAYESVFVRIKDKKVRLARVGHNGTRIVAVYQKQGDQRVTSYQGVIDTIIEWEK